MKKALLAAAITALMATASPAYDKTPLKNPDKIKQLRESVFCIENIVFGTRPIPIGKYFGTAFSLRIGKEVYLITNKHTISITDEQTQMISLIDDVRDTTRNAKDRLDLVYVSEDYDIAILKPNKTLPAPEYKFIKEPLELGDHLYYTGYPCGIVKHTAQGLISLEEITLGSYGQGFIFDGSISPGMSGSPIYAHEKGKVYLAGIVTSHLQGSESVSMGINSRVINEVLQQYLRKERKKAEDRAFFSTIDASKR